MSKGSQPAGTTTTTETPPAFMLPYMGRALGYADNLLSSKGPQYYPGDTVAGFSQPQQKAMQSLYDMGMGKTGQGGLNAANRFDSMLLNGRGSSPWLDQTFQQAAGATQNQLASEFAGAGRNTAASEPLRAEQLNNLATGIYGGAYQNDIQNALAAGSQAQAIYGTRMQGLNAAEGVGQQVQDQSQKMIDADVKKYGYFQQLPYQMLAQYEQALGVLQPGSSRTTPYFDNPSADLQQNAQTAMTLYDMYKMFGGGSKG